MPEPPEPKHAEEALRASELRYRRLFETAKDGILILDAKTGQITDVNPFLVHLLGYSYDEFIGTPLWEIGPFKDTKECKLAFLELKKKSISAMNLSRLKPKTAGRLPWSLLATSMD